MKYVSLLFALAVLFVSAVGRAAEPITVVNLMPAFFAADAPGVSLDERVQRFKRDVLYPNPEVYDLGYSLLDDPHLAWYLGGLDPRIEAIRSTESTIERALPGYEATFEGAFPNFNPADVRLYLMPSLGSFDGMTLDVQGKHALLLGVDNIAEESSPLGVLVDHELFHIYHHESNPAFFTTSSENDLYRFGIYRQVWAEGLATYVSQQLNPGTSEATALFSSALAHLSSSDERRLACFVDRDLDATRADDARLLFEGDHHPSGLPARGGYYVGYLVARELGRTRTLAQLAALSGGELHRAFASSVRALCGAH